MAFSWVLFARKVGVILAYMFYIFVYMIFFCLFVYHNNYFYYPFSSPESKTLGELIGQAVVHRRCRHRLSSVNTLKRQL